jgi:hypothetical protein
MRTSAEWREKYADADDSDDGILRCSQCRLPHAEWELEQGECVECSMKPQQCIGCLITLSRRDIGESGRCGACDFRSGSDIGTEREIGERI